jgi:hypothetical protein
MRALLLLLFFVLALTAVRAADTSDDDGDVAPSGSPGRLKGIDEEIQRGAVDPEETPEDTPEFADPYADDPDADETLPEDQPNADPDAEPAPAVEPAETPDEVAPKKPNKVFPNVLRSPLGKSPLDEGTGKHGAPADDD